MKSSKLNLQFSASLAVITLLIMLQMDEKDKLLLQEILRMKLSEDAISSMQLYNTTNKNEAVHRSLSVNLPKNVCNLLKRHGGQIGIWNSQKQQHARNLSKAWTKS